MLSFLFERDFQKIAKINSQQEKTVFFNLQNKLPQKFSATWYLS